jgi:AraC-like DNA-binding protein
MTLNLPTQRQSISALFLLRAYRACQLLGARRPILLKAMGLEEPQLRNPQRYYDQSTLSALFEASSEELELDDLVAKVANKMVPIGFSDPGFLAMFESSFGMALQKAMRAQRLRENSPVYHMRKGRTGDYIEWECESYQSELILQLGFAIIIETLRSLSGSALRAIKTISFAHSKPKEWNGKYLIFGDDAQILTIFDQPYSRIEFHRGFFDLANPNCNSPLLGLSKAQRSPQRWRNKPYAKSCYDYLIYLLDKPGPNLDSAAETFSMAERTLRRKLVAEGTSFRETLELARRDICRLYFLEGKRQLSDISTLLGYSELSAFTRAYTGWYGHPPSKDRIATVQTKLAA